MSLAWIVVALLAAPPAADQAPPAANRTAVAGPPAFSSPALSSPALSSPAVGGSLRPAVFRRLVDAVALSDGRQLAVAGQRSGSILVMDVASGAIEQEIVVGERLEALAVGSSDAVNAVRGTSVVPSVGSVGSARSTKPSEAVRAAQPTVLAAVDSARDQLSLLTPDRAGRWRVARRVPTVRWPISVCLARSGRWATIAGLWSRTWQVVPLDETEPGRGQAGTPAKPVSLSLPFAPRLQVELPDGRFFVTDAFGGQVAVLEVDPPRVAAVAHWPIHNIRGLAVAPDGRSVVLAHQTLNERLPIRREAILSGQLLRNGLSHVPLDKLLSDRQFEPLDELAPGEQATGQAAGQATGQAAVGFSSTPAATPATTLNSNPATTGGANAVPASLARGAGDPAGVAWLGERRFVALSGLSECLMWPPLVADSPSSRTSAGVTPAGQATPGTPAAAPRRWATGLRPLRVVALPAAGHVAVVGMLDDSLTFIDALGRAAPRRVVFSSHAQPTPQDRGERAFFDARLSAGGFLSCHSCHSEAHTNGRLSDTLGDDTDGAPKRVPTLLGTGMTYRWGWNGAQQSLHDQVLKSVEQTMGGTPRFQDGTDMVAFFHTLAPPPPLEPAAADGPFVERGRAVFTARGCGNCHVPPLVYASHESYDVGLSDERGLRKFNPPSLRGVSQGGRWLHDGRAASLEAVFRDHAHPHDSRWTDSELAELLRFLRSL